VTFTGDSDPVGAFVLLSAIFNRKGQQVWGRRLARIKTVLESPAPKLRSFRDNPVER